VTREQFESRLKSLGASERDAELIAAMDYVYWMDTPATKTTTKQREDMLSLLALRREEDELLAWNLNADRDATIRAGYLVHRVR
jgi:hypothetical protein